MRKGDLELLEVRLEPLQAARDRLTTDLGELRRIVVDLVTKVKDQERDSEAHKTDIAQGLASIRSLLQRANRAAREQRIIEDEDEEVVATPAPAAYVVASPDEKTRAARAKEPGRTIL